MFRFAQHDSAMSVSALTSSLGFHHCFDIRHLDPGLQPTRDICFLRADVSPCRNSICLALHSDWRPLPE